MIEEFKKPPKVKIFGGSITAETAYRNASLVILFIDCLIVIVSWYFVYLFLFCNDSSHFKNDFIE